MASQQEPQYWTWDKARNDYYHADFDRNTRAWKYVWAKDQITPRALPPTTTISTQVQPAPVAENYIHAPASSSGLGKATQGISGLTIGQSLGVQGQRPQPAYTVAVADRSRPTQQPYRMPTYIATPNHTPANPSCYGQSSPVAPILAYHTNPTGAGKRPVQYDQTQHQTSTRCNGAELVQGRQISRASHPSEQPARGSSSVAPTSFPYPPQNGNGTLYPPANGLTNPSVRDNLDPTLYKQIKYKTHRFFVVGKVFMMLYIENSGPKPELFEGSHFTTVAHGEVAYHQFRRFVVVQEVSKQFFCYCCPITTYGSRATTKPGVDQSVHAIVYTGKIPPEKLEGEKDMTKDPIRIDPVSLDEKLDPLSRINLGKAQVIQHNWKIREIGDVHEKSLPKLLHYRKAVRDN